MRLYTTSDRSLAELPPVSSHPTISMYCCGPTVYDNTHIGHIRKYTMDDVLKRSLEFVGYQVTHVMNVTDVGHLTDDADTGEDKLEKGARKTGMTVWEIAAQYTEQFVQTMNAMNVILPKGEYFCRATDNIDAMIETITALQKGGYTYETAQAVYFDVQSFPAYGSLSGQSLDQKKTAAREDVHEDSDKRHPADFALWFKRTGRFADHTMHWESPWGDGFPGWHIECSAMAMKFLGPQIDIHTGGIDHIPVHHENEIAQSECCSGLKPFARFWVHHAFLMVEGTKMSKSLGNVFTLDQVRERGIEPMALRLLFLQTHYRQEMNFTWNAAQSAQEAWERLIRRYHQHTQQAESAQQDDKEWSHDATKILAQFDDLITSPTGDQDLRIPQAVALLWEVLRSAELSSAEIVRLIDRFDQVFGLQISTHAAKTETSPDTVPDEVATLIKQRADARSAHDWATADALRDQIATHGFTVTDGPDGQTITKTR